MKNNRLPSVLDGSYYNVLKYTNILRIYFNYRILPGFEYDKRAMVAQFLKVKFQSIPLSVGDVRVRKEF
jgi:hypothetical protein